MHAPAPRVVYALLFFLLAMALIVVAQPRAIFQADGRPRPFGTGPAADGDGAAPTVFSLGAVTVVIATASLFVTTFIDAFLG